MSFKTYVQSKPALYRFVLGIRWIQYNVVRRSVFESQALLRKFGLQAAPITNYHNKYKGKRCFIIATGPSLTLQDIQSLRYEYTFAMNSLAQAYVQLGWGPTFYAVQDHRVYQAVKETIKQLPPTQLLLGSNLAWYTKLPKEALVFPLDLLNHEMHPDDHYNTQFSADCAQRVFDGYTIAYSLLQLAIYFGFSEIYLLGADCSYTGKKHHFMEHGVTDPHYRSATNRILFSYQVAKEYADRHHIKIYNATRGGALELFPRVNFDSISKRTSHACEK